MLKKQGASCGQHSALSTQHSALSTHQWLRHVIKSLLAVFIFVNSSLGNAQTTVYFYADISPLLNDYFSITSADPQMACDLAKPSFDAWLLPNGGTSSVSAFEFTDNLGVYACDFTYRPPNDTKPFPSWVRKDLKRIWCQQGQVLTKITEEIPPWGTVITGQCKDKPKPTLIGYFNGVANTQSDADDSLRELKKLEADFPSNRGPYKYDTFLNNTACTADNKVACIADIAEVFAQRSTELDGVLSKRWEIFWELLKGNHTSADALTKALQNKLVDRNNSFANLIIGLFDAFVGKIAAIFTNVASLFTGPSTQADVAGHLAKLQKHADNGSGMVLVAHSQGNLFVNEAYKRLKESHPNSKVEVVHVAPASPTLSGGHSLVDIDLVINALRITGINSVPDITKYIPPSDDDKTGHSFVATYMDQARAAYTEIKAMVIASVTKVAPAASN